MKKVINNLFCAEFFLPNILVPLLTLTLYCGLFAFLSHRYLVEGANYYFTFLLLTGLLVLIGVVVAVHFIHFLLFNVFKKNPLKLKKSEDKLDINKFMLVILPITPVVQYLLSNLEILSLLEFFLVVGFFILFSSIYIVIIPSFLGRFSSLRTLMALGLAFSLTITSMPSLHQNINWYTGRFLAIQILFFGGTFFIAWLLLKLRLTKVLIIIVMINFAFSSLMPFFSQDIAIGIDKPSLPNIENRLLSLVAEKSPDTTPNIYLLVYESYVSNETMLGYGIDNTPQEDYLKSVGFQLYPKTYSVGVPSLDSMSRVFNASINFYGNKRRGVSGDGVVHNLLNDLGYTTSGIFPYDYMFRGVGSNYDFSFPEVKDLSSFELLTYAILIGEFRSDLMFDKISRQEYVDKKQSVFKDVSEDSIFIYTHSDLPGHAQFTGGCRPDEIDLFKENLAIANLEMRQDIKIITENDPEAIIIIAGDHGPFLTKSCFRTSKDFDISKINRLDIQDRFGTFLAIMWPSDDYAMYDEITVLQDIFPAIFAFMYRDADILDSKISPELLTTSWLSGASVINGIISGGIHDGEPLFLLD